jgi:hypothetical protein
MERNEQDLWKSQEDQPMQFTTKEVCAKAHKYERQNVILHRVVLGLGPLLAAGFLWNLIRLREPWLMAGQACALAAWCYMVWELVLKGPHRMGPQEPCADFLRQELDGKRRGLVRLRAGVLLTIPAILASWWGGGPAKTWGFQLHSPAPLIVMAVILAFLFFAFSKEVQKIEREIAGLHTN